MSPLRKLFGPSKEEIWRQLSADIGATYVDGGAWKGDKVQARHGEWTVTLDTHTVSTGNSHVTYTRMRAPYVNPDGFRFTIYRRGLFTGIAKFFGMQDVEIGEEQFDEAFVIKTTEEGRLRSLLSSDRLRSLIAEQKAIYLAVKDDEGLFGPSFPEGVDELYFQVVGVIKDIDRLKALYDLFTVTLDELCRIGAAYERAPDVAV
jgi:hypothetical protein